MPRLLQQGRELISSLFPEGGIGPALEAGWNTVKAKFQGGMAYIRGLPGQFLDMGKNIASGLVDGIKSGITAAGDAIAGMAESVKNKFKGWLGIASPSKVFAGYGLNVAQGAALGIQSGAGEVAGAAADLAQATANGWTPPKLIVARPDTPVAPRKEGPAGRLERPAMPELPAVRQAVRLTPPAPLKPEVSPLSLLVDVNPAMAALSRLATWGKHLFAGLFPVPVFTGQAAGLARPDTTATQPEGTWQPPKLLTAPDGPAKIAAAVEAGRADGRGMDGGASPVNVTFSPSITIQGNAAEKDVRGALALTLPELERMIRRLMHDKERRAYV